MEVLNCLNPEIVAKAVAILRNGGMIVYPTETCYGLGVDATNQEAVNKLLDFKDRPQGQAISVAVCDIEMAEEYVDLNEEARNMYRNFLPGPVTVISNLKYSDSNETQIAEGLASEKGTLGIRIPDYKLVLEIVKQLGKPITATSASISSLPSPYSLEQWTKQTAVKSQDLVDLFIDAGELPRRSPSTVIDTTRDDIKVIRQGNMLSSENVMEKITRSEDETKLLAKEIIEKYKVEIYEKGLLIALDGDMGTGKTRFAQGVAKALGINENVKSPTFTIVEEYETTKYNIFFHWDVWRLENGEEIKELGFDEMLKPGNVIVIEWAEKIRNKIEETTKNNSIFMLNGTVERLGETVRKWNFV